MMITRSLPATQPSRPTTSWMTAERSGVRWSMSASPAVSQAAGDQSTDAVVVGREERSHGTPVNGVASSAASARMVSDAAPVSISSTLNWMNA